MVYRRKDAAHLCIGKDVRNKNIPACHKPIRDTVCLFSNRVQIESKSAQKSGMGIDYTVTGGHRLLQPVKGKGLA